MKKIIYILLCLVLTACAGATIPATPESITPTKKVSATSQPSRTPTLPKPTKTIDAEALLAKQAYNMQATKIAEFPAECGDFSDNVTSLSPDENWLTIRCEYKREQTLEIVNRNGKHWVLQFKDYLTQEMLDSGIPMGGLFPQHWSNDGGYLYFTTYVNYEGGGTCFYGFGSQGLYRIKLSDGTVSAILPVTPSVFGYDIAFSPTGRRLAYQANENHPIILDLKTGDEIIINNDDYALGNFVWSPDGLELAYATCQPSQDGYSVERSAIKIFSIQQRTSRTILEMEKIFLSIENWAENNIIKIANDDHRTTSNILLFDLSLAEWVTATPEP